MTIGP